MASTKNTTLFQDFIKYYNDYEKFIEEEKTQTPTEFCLTLFGVSGAGKSTFLSRLKSEMPADKFYADIISRVEDQVVVEDVAIGSGMTSTTIVPKLHQISSNLSIYDVPGFKDTDNNRKIIINILHKCLFNHIKHNKFIAVLRLDVLEEEKMTQLVGDYYDSFEALFGIDNFRRSIENVYFVITHFDKRNLSVNHIVEIISKRIMASIEVDKAQLAFFLTRLKKKHIIVDYKEDGQRDLLTKLESKLVEPNKMDGLVSADLNIVNLDVFENELNVKLQRDLEDYTKTIKSQMEKCTVELEKKKKDMEVTLKDRRTVTTKLKEVKTYLASANSFLETVDKEIEAINKQNKQLEYEIDGLLKEAEAQEAILEVLEKTLAEETLISVRVDFSQRVAGIMGAYFVYDNIIHLDASQFRERVILITAVEHDDATLKQFLQTGSIIPNRIEDIKAFKANIMLYNNGTYMPQANIKVETSYTETTKQLKITARCDFAFKIYVYYTEELNKNLVFNKTKDHFSDKIKANETKCSDFDTVMNQNNQTIEEMRLKDIEQRRFRELLIQRQTEYESSLKEFDRVFARQNADVTEILTKQQNALTDVKNTELYAIGNTILRIFTKNKLKSSIQGQIQQINRFVDASLSTLSNFKYNLPTLSSYIPPPVTQDPYVASELSGLSNNKSLQSDIPRSISKPPTDESSNQWTTPRRYTTGVAQLHNFEMSQDSHLRRPAANTLSFKQLPQLVKKPILDESVVKEGFLTKKGHIVKNWKNRYFVLKHDTLSYYPTQSYSDKDRLGVIDLTQPNVVLRKVNGNDKRFVITLPQKEFEIDALTSQERDSWVRSIQEVLDP